MSDIKSIAQIKQEFEQSGDDKEALYVQYAGDSRKGVQNLITKYQKEAQKLVKERERLETMRFLNINTVNIMRFAGSMRRAEVRLPVR